VLADRGNPGPIVVRFGDHLDVAVMFGQGTQAGADHFLVVDQYDPDHGNLAGISASTTNPAPGVDRVVNVPPSRRTRSFMPAMPKPPGVSSSDSMPRPLSLTLMCKCSSAMLTRTCASVAPACRTTLVIDSWITR